MSEKIIKYTYTAFCGLVFTSLVCVGLGKNDVWWYDAKNVCLESWQLGMILFGIFYVIPFPIALYFGMRFLKEGKICAFLFLTSCICPLPTCLLSCSVYDLVEFDKKDKQ